MDMTKIKRRDLLKKSQIIVPCFFSAIGIPTLHSRLEMRSWDLSEKPAPNYVLLNADLSGAYREEGLQQLDAVRLCVNEINKLLPDSQKWGVLVSDNQCREERVEESILSALGNVRAGDVKVLVGGSSSKVTLRQSIAASKYGWLHLPGTCQRYNSSRLPNLIASIDADLKASCQMIFEDIEARQANAKVFVLSDQYEWGLELEEFQREIASQMGFDTLFERISLFDNHLSKSVVAAIGESDFVILNRYSNHLQPLISELRDRVDQPKPIYLPSISDSNLDKAGTRLYSQVKTLLPVALLENVNNPLETLYQRHQRRRPLQSAARVLQQFELAKEAFLKPDTIALEPTRRQLQAGINAKQSQTMKFDSKTGRLVSKMSLVSLSPS
jgi:ABC-type branched-subunit amino acid transport system substrate-binding protein